ncbi:alpha/beta hydrolase [Brucella endophytica]|uniref:Alpha/beta hydrolase n=1 Tax=Brucella endophytica TaxID=1963359 RepID=A0A916SF32_9HYPH|nr:alpha/beta hydrolase [Brucella endophytica]GGA94278.1 alpha/beta hydrolase [Brucella endophytica]
MSGILNIDMLSPEMATLLARVAAESGPQPDPTMLPPAEGRALAAKTNRRWNVDLPAMAKIAEIYVHPDCELGSARVRVKVLLPRGAEKGAVLFVHGGGFAFCSPETHERCARVLALECGMPVLVPDYRLAPEHPYPAGLLDVIAVIRAALVGLPSFGATTGPLILAGDSAGANLVLAAMLHEQLVGHPSITGALLFYGTYANNFHTKSYREFEDGPGLTTAKMRRYWQWYAGDRDLSTDILACPLQAADEALAALPPLHLMAAGVDPLLSDSVMLHERLKKLGRNEALSIVPGVTHGFLQNTLDLVAAREALAAAGSGARRMAGAT